MNSYEALRSGAAWIDLSARGKIRVEGEDRARLLHAMSTNDVKDLSAGHGLYAFFLNDKGRILADANIYNLGETLFLDTEPETAQKLYDHLDRYIIADDATLEDLTQTWAAIGLEGPTSIRTATALGLPVPAAPQSVDLIDGGFVARTTATGGEGVRLFCPAEWKTSWTDKLIEAGVQQASSDEVRVVRLENGKPRYGEEITERYLVQETQQLSAIHFNKGCYLGQEIVERVRSRGQVHRLLVPVRIHASTPPAPGSKLNANGTDVAEISSAAFSPALHTVVGLAYARTEAVHKKPALALSGSEPSIAAQIA